MKFNVSYELFGKTIQANFDRLEDAFLFQRMLGRPSDISELLDGQFDSEDGYFSGQTQSVNDE
jgi:hypothetical protein